MSFDEEKRAQIRANVKVVIEAFAAVSGLDDFGLNESSVAWLENYIERRRLEDHDAPKLVSVFGSFLGEAIITARGGVWDECENGIGVKISPGNWAFPFNKVAKQFANGVGGGDGVLAFYQVALSDVVKSEDRG